MKLTPPSWPRLLPTPTVLACARIGPIGHNLPAPGTWGSLVGVFYFLVSFADRPGVIGILLLNAVGLYVAIALCGEAELRLGKKDPGEVILDEVMAMPLCYLGWSHLLSGPLGRWEVLLAGFVIFRFFDILKPLGIAKLQDLPGGWGVVIDDVAAALATCGVMHVALWGWQHFHL
jgi:phosphatidylglycerophosphatase A